LNQVGSSQDVAAEAECAPGAFPIVGVGASAGGLAATSELLQHLGAHSGVGIVAVHHLSPTHTSSLVAILSRATPLPVHLATDGICIERNHVYVVPPNADLLLDGQRLRLTARLEGSGLHLPVDRFFESLALGAGELAIGVLLSGSGSDGSAGVRAIKAAGGVIFAQDASAEYQSMPESAVGTGCVDLVLSPRGIAAEIARRGAEPAASKLVEGTSQPDEPAFARLLLLLRRASGIDFTNYKPGTLRRRAERRIFLRGMHSLEEYLALLSRDPAEAEALCEEVLIHVTSFFRDPGAFAALETSVFPELLRRRAPGAPIRVWVPGCSTGEEVYSLAISLLDFLARENVLDAPIKVFGTDVSGHATNARALASIKRAFERTSPRSGSRPISG
jgi:two-component system, chemotaxis family, CheB/CheR fusion protein